MIWIKTRIQAPDGVLRWHDAEDPPTWQDAAPEIEALIEAGGSTAGPTARDPRVDGAQRRSPA